MTYLMSHQADGQYQARDFIEGMKERIYGESEWPIGVDKFFVVPWDAAHWMDLCMSDMRVKEENGEVLRRLIQRMNKFHSMFGRGRGFLEYKGFTEERELGSFSTSSYSTTRFASSAFKTLQNLYKNYEGLAKTYERMRETTDEEEETRYLITLYGHDDLLASFKYSSLVGYSILAQSTANVDACKERNRR